jgi:uncharacterized protein YceK
MIVPCASEGANMRLRAICVALLLPAAGCGTVANQVHMQRDGGAAGFGGVHRDLDRLAKADEAHADTGHKLLAVADLPFSLVGDIVMWPYTKLFTHVNRDVPTDLMSAAPAPAVHGGAMPAPTIPTVPAPMLPTAPPPQPLPGLPGKH